MASEQKYDLDVDTLRVDAYTTFARMREHDPVHCQFEIDEYTLEETPAWHLTCYGDVQAEPLDDDRFVRDPRHALPPETVAACEAGLPACTWRPSTPSTSARRQP
jgi:hypothetical protein